MALVIAETVGTGAAANLASTIIGAIFQKLDEVRNLQRNLQILDTDFSTLESLLSHIRSQFQDQQKRLEEPLEKCLKNMDDALGEAKDLIDRAKRHGEQGWCLRCCCFLRNPNIPTQISAWKAKFNGLFQDLDRFFSIYANTQQIVSTARPQTDLLLQPVPDSGYIGSGIWSAQDQLQTWLTEPHCQSRVIGVHGMGGVGKTSLLKVIYNTYKEEVSGIFDFVLWFVVSQKFQIKELQDSIAKQLGLKLEEIFDIEERKMRLYASLHKKKFLIVLDDIWSPIDLIDKVGVRFGDHNQSKIIISTRNKEVIEGMGAIKYSVNIRPLTIGEGWDLFKRGAFTNGVDNESNIEEAIAKEIAAECKGLPLAINAVAAAMSCKETNEEWRRALNMMRTADPSFPNTHSTIDAELYKPLSWSYDDLSDPNLQICPLKLCFLYCAAFPEDAYIDVERLVQMWSGEGLVSPRGTTNFMDIGRGYIDVLVKRCLVEYSEDDGHKYLKVHDVLRDMAIYVGQKEEKWLFAAGQHLKNFPSEEQTRDCKRISIIGNDIHDLPMDFKCPNLVSLMLAKNWNLKVPEGFLSNLTCVRVLDLSRTSISSLPTSVGQLGQLEFLDLGGCIHLKDLPDSICNLSRLQFLNLQFCRCLHSLPSGIGALTNLKHLNLGLEFFDLVGCSHLKDLPDSICNLSRLQFLNLEMCYQLHSLPSGIGALTNLKHLNLGGCGRLVTIPHGIFQLTSLNKLVLPENCTVRAGDLANLSNLMELHATVKAEIDTMGPWLDMRALQLTYKRDADTNGDDVVEDILPESLKHMTKLETLRLDDYPGLSLPNCICEFQNMKNLILNRCRLLRELPALEIGSESAHASFPMLKRLELNSLDKLESIAGPSNVLNEKAMPQLEFLHIEYCPFAKKLISATEKLPNLKRVHISNCYWLEELDFGSGSFQMLRYLGLFHLYGLHSIGGSLNIWNEGTLPKLQELKVVGRHPFFGCFLRKLPLGMEKLSNLKIIKGELNWWQSIIWEDDEMKNSLSHLFREGY